MKGSLRFWPVFAGPLVTLALSFGWTSNTDSFKLLALGSVSGFALAAVVLAVSKSPTLWKSAEFLVAYFFLLGLSLPITFSNSPISQQIYGVTGRNLGFLHYLFLLFIFLGISTLDFNEIWPRILKSLFILGVFEGCYGGVQYLGLDPAPWKNPDRWMLGTFGNPNYLSSFLALSAIASMYFGVAEQRVAYKAFYFLVAVFKSALILISGSSQGLVLVFFGLCAIASILCFNRSKFLGLTSIIFSITLSAVGLLGVFQFGPLRKYLYQDSVSYRGDYWRAGMKMFREHWLHGVGLDSYGDYYRMYRDTIAASRKGLDVFSNSSHNLFIDLAATGGVPLVLGYLALTGLVVISIITTLWTSKGVPFDYKLLIILWLAFNLQTLISINVPSLAIWGWIFSGLIVAYGNKGEIGISPRRYHGRRKNYHFILITFFCCTFCVALVSPLINRDVKIANAFTKNHIPEISAAILTFPKDADLITGVAIAYGKLGRAADSLKLAKSAISENRNCVRAWRVIYMSEISTPSEKDYAQKMLRKLDPFQISLSN